MNQFENRVVRRNTPIEEETCGQPFRRGRETRAER